jgi:hypothetical protein
MTIAGSYMILPIVNIIYTCGGVFRFVKKKRVRDTCLPAGREAVSFLLRVRRCMANPEWDRGGHEGIEGRSPKT